MKTKYLFTLIFLFLSFFVQAQYFNAGIKAGIVGSQVDGDGYGGYDKFGINGGLFVNYKISMLTSLQLEMEYIQKGSSHTPNVENGDYDDYKLHLGYIQLPVLFQYKLAPNFTAELGPAFGLLISHYEEWMTYEIDYNPFRKFALSWVTGINYKISEEMNANFRFDYSLMAIRQQPAPKDRYILFQYGQFCNSLVFSIQYKINHAREK
jgi:hypothetical protein